MKRIKFILVILSLLALVACGGGSSSGGSSSGSTTGSSSGSNPGTSGTSNSGSGSGSSSNDTGSSGYVANPNKIYKGLWTGRWSGQGSENFSDEPIVITLTSKSYSQGIFITFNFENAHFKSKFTAQLSSNKFSAHGIGNRAFISGSSIVYSSLPDVSFNFEGSFNESVNELQFNCTYFYFANNGQTKTVSASGYVKLVSLNTGKSKKIELSDSQIILEKNDNYELIYHTYYNVLMLNGDVINDTIENIQDLQSIDLIVSKKDVFIVYTVKNKTFMQMESENWEIKQYNEQLPLL